MLLKQNRVIIIGANAGGLTAAFKLRRLAPEFDITLYERLPRGSYRTCWLPYFLSNELENYDALFTQDMDSFKKAGIKMKVNHIVEKIEPYNRKVHVYDQENTKRKIVDYDFLIIATGASPIIPPIAGIDSADVFTIRKPADVKRLKDKVDTGTIKNVAIVGGGYIGLEVTEALTKRGVKVHLVEKGDHLFPAFDTEMAESIAREATGNGVELYLETSTETIDGHKKDTIVTINKGNLTVDAVVLAAGMAPNSQLASDAKIATSATGAIKVDKFMTTNHAKIFAAGDCCTVKNKLTGKDDYIPLGTYANREGKLIAMRLANEDARMDDVVGTAVTRFFNLTLCSVGLNEALAREHHFQPVSKMIQYQPKSLTFHDAPKTSVKLIADKATNKLLGAQISGNMLNAERINIVALALQRSMTVGEFINSDLAYTPPYSGVWSPLVIAAKELIKSI